MRALMLLLLACAASCSATAGPRWDVEPDPPVQRPGPPDTWRVADGGAGQRDVPLEMQEPGAPPRAALPKVEVEDDLFRNTYYDFPREGAGAKEAIVFDAACAPIAKVTQAFHDQVCVQGSGRLVTGDTVSFAKRDCACAAVCPRTGQKICFERLDPARFPNGRGASGSAITPMRTVAVDPTVIPLGARLYVPEMAGLPRPDGTMHDGCFVAEDRGLKVVGRHVDVFTGDPALTAQWNAIVPSNRGVHVHVNDPRCTR